MLQHKSPETVCGTVQNINREGETARVMTLAELKETQVDMFTTVFIGNSQTRNIDGKMVTPRGYKKSDVVVFAGTTEGCEIAAFWQKIK